MKIAFDIYISCALLGGFISFMILVITMLSKIFERVKK